MAEINRIEGSEFPYQHSADCVNETKDVFTGHREVLDQITPSTDAGMVEYACNAAAADVRSCLDLLGFLLRSTNVRNAFEAYGPLLRMTAKALGSDNTRLVISSEWNFSPFTYVGFDHLPEAVLIGLPASESSNPLLLPLAGHELGHNAWRRYGMDATLPKLVEDAVITEIQANWAVYNDLFPGTDKTAIRTDLLARSTWVVPYNWTMKHCEEYFCDFFGLRLFGESFLYAFAYLLAPLNKTRRSTQYPGLRARAAALTTAASTYGITVPTDYLNAFGDLDPFTPEQQRGRVLLNLADRVAAAFLPYLIEKAGSLLHGFDPPHTEEHIERILKRFSLRVPAEGAGGITNLLAAAWRARLDPRLIILEQMDAAASRMLAEIVWKSIEIDEIEFRMSTS